MRMLLICLVAAAAALTLAPGTQDFRKRYGEPDTERFIARPGISLTVQYASDHLAWPDAYRVATATSSPEEL